MGDRLRRVCDRLWVVVTGIVVGRRVVPGPRIGKPDTEADKCRSMVVVAMVVVAKALVVVEAVEVAMAVADMPAVDLAAADMAAAFARKRGVADNYCERAVLRPPHAWLQATPAGARKE
ncbi:MAG TPA: hypothetical protein VFT23_11070 [Burkholderiales bacterium]|nr:hypothetical protein [Burkholderiales bacterium]